MTSRSDLPADFLDREPGAWHIGHGCVYIMLPTVGMVRIPTEPGEHLGPVWQLTFESDGSPTLSPSILTEAPPRGSWHGWLRAGKLVEA